MQVYVQVIAFACKIYGGLQWIPFLMFETLNSWTRNASLSLLIAFSVTNGSKTSEIWRRKEFLLLCIRKACMLRYCALSRSLVKIRLQDMCLPHFSKTIHSFCLILSWRAVVKSKYKFNNNLRQGLLFLYVYFLFSIFHSNRPKKCGKESRVLKKPIIFCAEDLIHTVGNNNENITKLSWKFEENRTSGRFYFSNKKKH